MKIRSAMVYCFMSHPVYMHTRRRLLLRKGTMDYVLKVSKKGTRTTSPKVTWIALLSPLWGYINVPIGAINCSILHGSDGSVSFSLFKVARTEHLVTGDVLNGLSCNQHHLRSHSVTSTLCSGKNGISCSSISNYVLPPIKACLPQSNNGFAPYVYPSTHHGSDSIPYRVSNKF